MSGIAGTVNELRPKLDPNLVILCDGEYYQVGELSDTGLTGFRILEGGGVSKTPTHFLPDKIVEIQPGVRIVGSVQE